MRQKNDEKRQEIISVATELFLSNGYEVVSMSQISESLGGSKSTLYGYFSNKEELFLDVVSCGIERMADMVCQKSEDELPLRERLRSFSLGYLNSALNDDAIALRRTVLSISNKSDAGRKIYSQVTESAWKHIANVLEKEMDVGKIRKEDSFKLALRLKSLLENDMAERRLMCVENKPQQKELERHVDEVLDFFLGYYSCTIDG